jgi:preprotein translocase subunit SecE
MILKIYKSGQGKNTRLFSAFGLAVIAGLGSYELYRYLNDTDINDWVETLVPVLLFAGFAFLIYLLVNKPNVADFMIASEGEMKKVSWSSRQEIVASTIIVLIVVIFMAVLLGTADFGFSMFFNWFFG